MIDFNRPTVQRFTLSARLKSFSYAGSGICFMLKTQHNAWLHLVATILVIIFGYYLQVSATDWRWLIAAIILVWMAETFNSAVEYVCDVISPGYSDSVKYAKDISAGAVLICAIGAALIGILTLWPYLT